MQETYFDSYDCPDFLASSFEMDDWYLIITRLRELLSANIISNAAEFASKQVIIKGEVYIGKNVHIGDFVTIEGPAYIDDNAEIGSHSHIRPGSIIGKGCVLGYTAGIKNSIMMDGSKISNHAFVGDSILGSQARVGGHAETSNRRFDQKAIDVIIGDKKYKTGSTKYGMILGEGSRIGADVMVSPGCTIGKQTFISSGIQISGFVPQNSYVKSKSSFEIVPNQNQIKIHNNSKLYTGKNNEEY